MSRKLAKIATAASTAVATLLVNTRSVLAYYDNTVADEGVWAWFTGMGLICQIISCIFSLAALGFTIWMVVDVNKRDESVLPKKTMWMVLMIVGAFTGGWGVFVAIYYFFARKKKLDAMGK